MKMARRRAGPSEAGFAVTLVAATFLMGSSFVAGKILLVDGFPPVLLVGWRFFAAAAAALPLVVLTRSRRRADARRSAIRPRDAALVVVIGLLQTGAVMGLLFLAMQTVSASVAAILLFTNPVWVALLSRLFLGEPLHGVRVAGLGLGVAGVALAVGPGAGAVPGTLTGEWLGLAAALCWAAATVIHKRAALPLNAWSLSFWQMLIGSLALLALAYGRGEHWPPAVTPAQWGCFLWLAVPASTGSFGLWFIALRKGGAVQASGYLFLAPVFAMVLSFCILGVGITWLQTLGGALVALALWLVTRAGGSPSKGDGTQAESCRSSRSSTW
ncbi:MAG: DMT family transporter [Xenophilus sp.]